MDAGCVFCFMSVVLSVCRDTRHDACMWHTSVSLRIRACGCGAQSVHADAARGFFSFLSRMFCPSVRLSVNQSVCRSPAHTRIHRYAAHTCMCLHASLSVCLLSNHMFSLCTPRCWHKISLTCCQYAHVYVDTQISLPKPK